MVAARLRHRAQVSTSPRHRRVALKFGKSHDAINAGAAGLLEFSSGKSGRLHALATVLPWRAAADTPEHTGEMSGVTESELLGDDVELVVGLRQEALDDFNPNPRRVLLYAHPCLAPEQIRELSTR